MSVIATPTGYSMRIDANASGYVFSGLQRVPSSDEAKYIIWVSGSLYQTFNTAYGIVEYSGSSIFDAIKVAQSGANAPQSVGEANNPFSGSSEILIKDGLYIFGSGFTGFDLRNKTHIHMAHQACLLVPTGYSGDFFRLYNRAHFVKIQGGVLAESGTTSSFTESGRLWTAFHFQASGSANGVAWNKIEDVEIHNAKHGFHFDTSTQGWINSNTIQDCAIIYPYEGIKITAQSGAIASQGLNSNNFINISVQAAASGTIRAGVMAESGRGNRNTWLDCTVWDVGGFGPDVYSAKFGPEMMNQIIIGGAMTHYNWEALGSGVLTFDAYTAPRFDSDVSVGANLSVGNTLYTNTMSTSGIATLDISNAASGGSLTLNISPGSGSVGVNLHLEDAGGNEGLGITKLVGNNITLDSRRIGAGATMRPMVIRFNDTVDNTLIEALRISVSGDMEFNRSGGTVQFKSGNSATAASGTTANSGAYTPAAYITAKLGTRAIKIPFFD